MEELKQISYTKDEAAERLLYGRQLGIEIEELKEARERAFYNAMLSVSKYKTDVVKTTSFNTSERKNISYSDYGLLLEKKVCELEAYRIQMIDAIYTVDESRLRGILIGYYINCKTWAQVAIDADYNVRHVLRLHNIALKKIMWK